MGFALEAMALPLKDLGFSLTGTLLAAGFLRAGSVKKNRGLMEKALALGIELARVGLFQLQLKNHFLYVPDGYAPVFEEGVSLRCLLVKPFMHQDVDLRALPEALGVLQELEVVLGEYPVGTRDY